MPESARQRLFILLAGAALAGCSAEKAAVLEEEPPAGEWRASLEGDARREKTKPDRRAQSAPPPPGVDLLEPAQAAAPLSSRDEAIAHFAQPVPESAKAPVEAVRAYVAGRTALRRGNAASAATDLERAAELDPSSHEVLTALGEARLTNGDRLAALSAFREAFSAGGRAPGMLLLLGLQSQREADQTAAAEYLATLLQDSSSGEDPAVAPLAGVAFGESLLALGHPRAAREALVEGLDVPAAWTERTRFSAEIAALYRSRPVLWRLVGDICLRLNDHGAALAAYDKAARILPSQAWALLERRVWAAMRAGNPAEAVQLVLQEVADDPAQVRERHVRLMNYIRENRTDGDARAVRTITAAAREKLAGNISPTLASRLARLEAAACGERAAAEALLQHLMQSPLDHAAGAALVERLPSGTSAILRAAGPVAEREPGAAASLGAALLERRGLPDADARPRDLGGRILLAAWLREAGQADPAHLDAAQRVAAPLATQFDSAPALEMAGLIAVERADWTGAEQALTALIGDEPARRRARASLLNSLQRFEEALSELRSLDLDAEPPRTLLLGAQLAAQAGQAQIMAELLQAASARDPYAEEPYIALVEAHRARGEALTDQRRQIGARLQTLSPDGTALLLLRTRELAMAGQHAQAFAQATALAEREPRDPVVRDLALDASEQLIAADPSHLDAALRWLAGAQHWDPTWPAAAEARLRLAAGQAQQAEQLLREALAQQTSPRLEQALEAVLIAAERHTEADELALTRLAESPAGFDEVSQRAAILARRGEPGRALELLRTLPPRSRFTDRQALLLLSGVQPAVQSSLQGGLPQEMGDTLELIRAAKSRLTATPAIHLLQFQLATALTDAGAAAEAIRGMEEAGVVRQIAASYGITSAEMTESRAAAEICYALGQVFNARGRQAAAEEIYRAGLSYEPRHGWTCNNLGYALVERGERIEEAERLLLTAYEELQTEASVVDSLGWLRYRQGRFEDWTDPESGESHAGAVSLLREAVSSLEGAQNPTLRDHYGDALWRIGRREDARHQWNQAIVHALDRVRQERQEQVRSRNDRPGQDRTGQERQGRASSQDDGAEAVPHASEMTALLGRLRQKVGAASAGQAPPLAPLFDGVSLEEGFFSEDNLRDRQE